MISQASTIPFCITQWKLPLGPTQCIIIVCLYYGELRHYILPPIFFHFHFHNGEINFKKISVWTGLHAQVHLFLANTEELDCKKLSFKVLHSTQLFNIHGNAHTKKMQIPHIYQRAFFEAMDKCHALLFAFSSQNLPVWCYKKHRVCIFSICMYFHFEFLHTYPRFEMQVVAFRSYWRKGASTLHSHKKSIFTFHTWMHLKC